MYVFELLLPVMQTSYKEATVTSKEEAHQGKTEKHLLSPRQIFYELAQAE